MGKNDVPVTKPFVPRLINAGMLGKGMTFHRFKKKHQNFRLVQIECNFAEDKSNITQNLKFDLGRVENILRKGENAGYQHFLLFSECFQRFSFSESFNLSWNRVVKS